MIKLQKDKELLTAYQKADYRVCDSKIVEYTLKFLGTPIKEKISGSDLFPAFYNYNRDNEDIKIFLLGGQAGVPEQAQANINAKVGRNMVVEAYSPSFGFEKNEAECLEIIEKINQSGATVLAIGVGAPKQEKWIIKYRHLLPNIKIFLAIGATIDFEAGNKSRSPKWVSEAGLEWLYRLASEPRRLWKRYLVESLPFFALVLKQKLHLGFTEPVINENALSL
jgi:exopolysaccharide biosynthesis WecB/TagA/CpsF family protein